MNKILEYMLGVLVCMAVSNSAWAALACIPLNGAPRTDTVQLSPPTISAGADIPVGTVIFQGQWMGGETGLSVMKCSSAVDTTIWYTTAWSIDQAPMPLANWSGSPFAGAVYQTNIPGVGVAISRSPDSEAFILGQPHYRPDVSSPVTGGSYEPYLLNRNIYVTLIKIGTITPGNYTLNAASLPTSSISIVSALTHPATTGLPIKAYIVKLQGQLTVSAQTCTTPNVNVNLGSFDTGEHFTGQGATTPWVDASIALTNCPTFYGFYNANNSTLMFNYNTGAKVANSANNSIGVRLTPTTSVLDAANGIMAIDSSVSGAATGVGIQLGWGNSSQAPTLFNFAGEQAVTLPKDGSPTIRVPLAARYIQTAPHVSPGKANGKVTFTINYY
ncbi:TPA: fimbrial protein [Serratia fonticola]